MNKQQFLTKKTATISDITEYELDEKTIYIKNLNRKSEEKIIMDKANYYNRKNLPYFSFLTNFISKSKSKFFSLFNWFSEIPSSITNTSLGIKVDSNKLFMA